MSDANIYLSDEEKQDILDYIRFKKAQRKP